MPACRLFIGHNKHDLQEGRGKNLYTKSNLFRPKIGITVWRRDLPTFLGEKTDLHTLDPDYANCVLQAGGIPILIPPPANDLVHNYVDLLDGLIVSGGGDISPVCYGEKDTGQSYDVNVETDRFELALIREAAKQNLPTLGICRGFQLLQVAFGGKMLQNLHEMFPHHPQTKGSADKILAQRHTVTFTNDSIFSQIYQTTHHSVNTIHHQCVLSTGKGFRATGWSEDGIIEAAESETSWLALGVQWHPEKMKNPQEQELFRYFVQRIDNQKEKVK
jgi:putative glutamine amidotransferase